jgi:hypothetical protein
MIKFLGLAGKARGLTQANSNQRVIPQPSADDSWPPLPAARFCYFECSAAATIVRKAKCMSEVSLCWQPGTKIGSSQTLDRK